MMRCDELHLPRDLSCNRGGAESGRGHSQGAGPWSVVALVSGRCCLWSVDDTWGDAPDSLRDERGFVRAEALS